MTCLAASYLGSGLALASARQEPSSFRAAFVVQWAALVPQPVVACPGGIAQSCYFCDLFLFVLAKLAKSHLGHELTDNLCTT